MKSKDFIMLGVLGVGAYLLLKGGALSTTQETQTQGSGLQNVDWRDPLNLIPDFNIDPLKVIPNVWKTLLPNQGAPYVAPQPKTIVFSQPSNLPSGGYFASSQFLNSPFGGAMNLTAAFSNAGSVNKGSYDSKTGVFTTNEGYKMSVAPNAVSVVSKIPQPVQQKPTIFNNALTRKGF